MAGEEEAWRPLRLWRWDTQPATSLEDIPRWIGRMGFAAALTITGGPAFCYLAYQMGLRDGVPLRSTAEPHSHFRWRLVPWAILAIVLYLMPMFGFAGVPMPLLLLSLAAPLVACLVVAHVANLCYRQGLLVGAKTGVAPGTLVTPEVRSWVITGIFFLGTLLIYYLTYSGPAVHNHPVRLADAFLHGRLHIADGPQLIGFLDFAIADDGKHYPLEPPGSALVILIGVALFGLAINQTLVSVVIGALTASVVWRLCSGIMKTLSQQVGLTILFVFGTIYWWNATYHGVWYFNHAVAVLFLFGAVYETLVSKRPLTAGILLGAAYITRAPSSLTFPFFLIMFSDQWLRWDTARPLLKRIDLKPLILFGVGAGVFVVAFAIFNYVRFDTVSPRAAYDHWHYLRPENCGSACQPGGLFGAGFFDLSYVPRHIPLIFEKPFYQFDYKPYVAPSWGGNAFWMTMPVLLFAFLAGIKNRWVRWAGVAAMLFSILVFAVLPNIGRGPTSLPSFDWAQWSTKEPTNKMIFNIPLSSWLLMAPFLILIVYGTFSAIRSGNKLVAACWIAIVPTAIVHFSHGNTGYPQIGYRYILDYAPFVFLLTWQGMGPQLKWHHVALITVSVVISLMGVLWANKFDAEVTGGFHWVFW